MQNWLYASALISCVTLNNLSAFFKNICKAGIVALSSWGREVLLELNEIIHVTDVSQAFGIQ